MSSHDRGEHRPFFQAWFDGKDYRELTPEARLTVLTLKGTLGACGIKADPGLEMGLARRTGLAPARIEAALTELETAGWIERGGDITWLVRGFEFEPQLISSNRKHKVFVERSLAALPRLPIVDRFRARYAEWFPKAPDSLSIPNREAIRITAPAPTPTPIPTQTTSGPVDLSKGERRPHSRVDNSNDTAPLVACATRNDNGKGTDGPTSLPSHATKLLRSCYASASPRRQGDVRAQLVATLGAGAQLDRKTRVQAVDVDHLDDVCRRVLAKPPTDRDKAIRFVLLQLHDTYGLTRAARDKAAHHTEPPRRRIEGSGPTPIAAAVQAAVA